MSLCPAARVLIALDIFSSGERRQLLLCSLLAGGAAWAEEKRDSLPLPPIPQATLAKSLFSVVNQGSWSPTLSTGM